MANLFPLLLCTGTAFPVSAFSELLDAADGAAAVKTLDLRSLPRAGLPGWQLTVRVEEVLWGDLPPVFSLWFPASPCHRPVRAPSLVVGYVRPSSRQQALFQLPPRTFLCSGILPHSEALVAALKQLKFSPGSEQLVAALEAPMPEVRREAFRQLRKRLGTHPAEQLLGKLLTKAQCEADPALREAYLSTFGHFRYRKAEGLVTETLLSTSDERVAAGAQWAFLRLATPSAYDRLAAAYRTCSLRVKSRVLHVMARSQNRRAQAVIAEALRHRETALVALKALVEAGRPLPDRVPRFSDPLKAQRMQKLLLRALRTPGRAASPQRRNRHAGTR